MIVAPAIHQISYTLPTGNHAFGYLLDDPAGCVLVDSGWGHPSSYDQLCEQVAVADRRLSDIQAIVLTHLHPDHAGQARRIRREIGVTVIAPLGEQTIVDRGNRDQLIESLRDLYHRHGVADPDLPTDRFTADIDADWIIGDGDVLDLAGRRWRVVETPGHSPGHCCLLDDETGLLLGGDLLLPTILPNVGMQPESAPDPLGQFRQSIARVAGLTPTMVLPGHEHTFDTPIDVITTMERRIESRLNRLFGLLNEAPQSAASLAERWRSRPGKPWTLTLFACRLAFQETIAYLNHLVAAGRAQRLAGGYVAS